MSRSSARRLSSSSVHHRVGRPRRRSLEVGGVDVATHHQPLEPERLLDTASAQLGDGRARRRAPRAGERAPPGEAHRGPAAPASPADGRTARPGPRAARTRARSASGPTAAPRHAPGAARSSNSSASSARSDGSSQVPRTRASGRPSPSGTACHGPSSVRHQADESSAAAPGFSRRSAVTSCLERHPRLGQRRRLLGRDSTVKTTSVFGSSSSRPDAHTASGGASDEVAAHRG